MRTIGIDGGTESASCLGRHRTAPNQNVVPVLVQLPAARSRPIWVGPLAREWCLARDFARHMLGCESAEETRKKARVNLVVVKVFADTKRVQIHDRGVQGGRRSSKGMPFQNVKSRRKQSFNNVHAAVLASTRSSRSSTHRLVPQITEGTPI